MGDDWEMGEALSIFKSEQGEANFLASYERVMANWPIPYETLRIRTDYGDCHVVASGPADGKPIVILHGMTMNAGMWYPNIGALSSFRTYCVDAPGDFGKTKLMKMIQTKDDAIQWIDQLLDGLGLRTASFTGHSMGGWLTVNYALARPERVERLALLAPVATLRPLPLVKMLRHIYPAMLKPAPDRIKRGWRIFCAKGYTLPDELMAMIIEAYTHCQMKLAVVPGVFPTGAWKAIADKPVLFLVGDQEQIYSAKAVVKRAAQAMPHADIQVIANAGHCLTIEQSAEVNAALSRFFASVD